VRYEEGRLSLRFGSPAAPDRDVLASLEARHAREIEALRAEVRSLGRRADDGGAVLQQVTDLIRESEARQAARLETGIAGLAQQAETRRRYDLARIGAGLAYIDAKNGHQFSRTTELVGHVLEASQKRGER
jgi:hypothetical protein